MGIIRGVCPQYGAGMAAASQTIIIRTALSYQDLYEVSHRGLRDSPRRTGAVSAGVSPILEARCPRGVQAALHDAADWNQQGQQDAAVQHSERGKRMLLGLRGFRLGFAFGSLWCLTQNQRKKKKKLTSRLGPEPQTHCSEVKFRTFTIF